MKDVRESIPGSPRPHPGRPHGHGRNRPPSPVDPELLITAGASRVAFRPLCYMPSLLPRQVGGSCSLILFPLIGLPQVRGGSAPASWISRLAQRSLTLRPARLQSRHYDPLPPEASAALLPPPLLRLLPGGTNQFPGGTRTHCGLNAFHGARGPCQ